MAFKGRFILASASPRRIELLKQLGLEFEVMPAQGKEPNPSVDESPSSFAKRAALQKAKEIQDKINDPKAWILAADTIVVLDKKILGKPQSEQEAEKMLSSLQNRQHTVYTAFAICQQNEKIEHLEAISSKVYFRALSEKQIKGYIKTGEPMDKAGAYGIQIKGACLVKKIDGCYFNVVGLPLSRVCQVLEDLKGDSFLVDE